MIDKQSFPIRFNLMLKEIVWWLIITFLLFLPFQRNIEKLGLYLPNQIIHIDEVFIVVFFGMFFLVLFYKRRIDKELK